VIKRFAFVLLIGLAACSSKKPEEGQVQAGRSIPVVGAVPGAATSTASGAPGSGAATGSAAMGSAESTGSAAAPAPPDDRASVGCATAITLTCAAGQRDGCTGGLTAVHVCVADGAKAGPPCVQKVALTCPEGQADACLRSPPLANHHVCVVVPKPPS
jgi:hypothetical protein